MATNTEFTEQPICTSSREYQKLKIEQLQSLHLPADEYQKEFDTVTEKVCLCEGLCASAYLKYEISKPKESKAVAICPGPNLAYFSRVYSLDEMVKHIYGVTNLLDKVKRPNMFIKELNLYIDYLKADIHAQLKTLNDKKVKQLTKFKSQLQAGIDYYKNLFTESASYTSQLMEECIHDLLVSERQLNELQISYTTITEQVLS